MMTGAAAKTEEKKAETKAKPKKTEAPSKPSTAKEPVKLVRELCEAMKGKPRKEVIAAAVARGVNKWTAATQYQLWRKPKAKKAAAK